MRVAASAPGKAVLSGEYAVLQGAPAIAMAIDCRARVTIETSNEGCHSVASTNHGGSPSQFRSLERGAIEWLDDHGAHADQDLLEQVWQQLGVLPARSFAVTLDTRSFYDPESTLKLGFGSSSALAVALAAALVGSGAARNAAGDPRDLLHFATAAHRAFQGGKGSGIDVAVAVHGGVIAFGLRPQRQVKSLKWPAGLGFEFFWSGRPSSTIERLGRMERFRQNRAARRAAERLSEASRGVLDAWRHPADILESLRTYTAALKVFSNEHALGVFDAGHEELSEAADALDLVYKPCGAGGGDIGVLIASRDSPAGHLADFSKRAGQLGYRKLDASLEQAGANIEH